MNNDTIDDFESGLADAKSHFEYVQYKVGRMKSSNASSPALMAALDNELLLAKNHIDMLKQISEMGGQIKTLCTRSIVLGKLKVRYDRLVELDSSKDEPDKVSRIKESVMNEIIELGSRLKSVG